METKILANTFFASMKKRHFCRYTSDTLGNFICSCRRYFFSSSKTVEADDSSTNEIPSITDLQQSLSSLQVQDTQDAAITHALPLSPPGDSQTSPLLPQGPLLTHPQPVSPSQVLPTPPPSSETSPVVSLTGRGANHMTTADSTSELMLP